MNQTERKTNGKKVVLAVVILLVLAVIATVAANYGKISALLSPEQTVNCTLSINVKGETVKQLELCLKPEQSLLDAMQQNLELEQTDGFITSVCGYVQNADTFEYWTYTVNGETLMVGAADYYPQEGDVIVFNLDVVSW